MNCCFDRLFICLWKRIIRNFIDTLTLVTFLIRALYDYDGYSGLIEKLRPTKSVFIVRYRYHSRLD